MSSSRGKHRIDKIVPRALLTQLHFQAISEEGKEMGCEPVDTRSTKIFFHDPLKR